MTDWLDSYRVVGRMPLEPHTRTYSERLLSREDAVAVRNEYRALEKPHLLPGQRSRFTVTTERQVRERKIDDHSWSQTSSFHEINPPENEEGHTMYRTLITIYSNYDGTKIELVDLARAATDGDAYCEQQTSSRINKADLPTGAMEFFSE
jgi:hypothetical protein